jgi:hypothetical protein
VKGVFSPIARKPRIQPFGASTDGQFPRREAEHHERNRPVSHMILRRKPAWYRSCGTPICSKDAQS